MTEQEDILIRPMRQEDLAQVRAIDRLSFSLPWPEQAYSYELLENPAARLWVAEAELPDGQRLIVGMIVVWLVLDEAHIATLAVHPEFRRRGIAKRLLVTALRSTVHEGARQAMLEVRASNHIAQNLYRQFGFVVVGRRPRYYLDNNEDAILMTLHRMDATYLQWLEALDCLAHAVNQGHSQ